MGKRMGISGILVMLFVFAIGLSLRAQESAPEKITGKVVKIDARHITVKTDDGREQVVKAKTEMLQGIAVGDKIEVDKTKKLIRIMEKSGTPVAAPAEAPAGREKKE